MKIKKKSKFMVEQEVHSIEKTESEKKNVQHETSSKIAKLLYFFR
jgi:hypothetical protein